MRYRRQDRQSEPELLDWIRLAVTTRATIEKTGVTGLGYNDSEEKRWAIRAKEFLETEMTRGLLAAFVASLYMFGTMSQHPGKGGMITHHRAPALCEFWR